MTPEILNNIFKLSYVIKTGIMAVLKEAQYISYLNSRRKMKYILEGQRFRV